MSALMHVDGMLPMSPRDISIFMHTLKANTVLLTLVIANILAGCAGKDPRIEEAKRSLEADLVDPGSVQYKDVVRYADGTVCGQYNAKNRMGGYTGFERFIYRNGSQVTRSHVSDNFSKLCSNDTDKTEVTEHQVANVEFAVANSGGKRKTASVNVYLYIDADKGLLVLDKSDAIRARIKRVFDGRDPKELEGDQLQTALLNELVSDKDLAAIRRVRYTVWP